MNFLLNQLNLLEGMLTSTQKEIERIKCQDPFKSLRAAAQKKCKEQDEQVMDLFTDFTSQKVSKRKRSYDFFEAISEYDESKKKEAKILQTENADNVSRNLIKHL